MSDPILIVGAGQSAAQAIATLRSEGFGGRIQLFGDEPYLPYQRPPLSKAFLAGETTPERLELRPMPFYEERGIELKLGCRILGIRPGDKTVDCAEGRSWPYSKLLITTGTRPRPLALPGDALAGVHHIRAIRDVERFREEFAPGARLVIIGGGYIGLEVAAKARKLGLVVTVLEAAPRVLARVVAEETATFLTSLHRDHGVVIRTGTSIARFLGSDRLIGVEIEGGEVLPADIALVAIGAVPNVELAEAAGIATGNGILVDASTRTNVPDIYAAGDVACFQSGLYDRALRLESVQNAIDQAKIAARAMLGQTPTYDPVPWFWSDQFETKLQIAGLCQGFTRTEIEGNPAEGRFSLRYFAENRLIAVDSLNDPKAHLTARRGLAPATPGEVAA